MKHAEFWNKRLNRLDFQNIFIKMNINKESELEMFAKLPYKKIGFSSVPAGNCSDIIDFSKKEIIRYIHQNYSGFWSFINEQANIHGKELKHYDVIRLLLGEESYRRTLL